MFLLTPLVYCVDRCSLHESTQPCRRRFSWCILDFLDAFIRQENMLFFRKIYMTSKLMILEHALMIRHGWWFNSHKVRDLWSHFIFTPTATPNCLASTQCIAKGLLTPYTATLAHSHFNERDLNFNFNQLKFVYESSLYKLL